MPEPTPTPAPTPTPSPAPTPEPAPTPAPSPSPSPAPAPSPAPTPTPDPTAATNWGADWREKYADKDDKKLNTLKRYDSPKSALDALFAAQTKISSGELKAPLPKDATPEQLATFRKENGLPEKPEGYFEKLPAEVKLTDADKAHLTPYATWLHEANVSPEAAAKFLAVRNQQIQKLVDDRQAADAALKTQTEDKLRADWGNDYRANINNIHSLFAGAGPELKDKFFSARMPDGTPLTGTPEVMQWLSQLARTVNPFSTIVSSGGGGSIFDSKGLDGRITEIEKMMGNAKSDYWNKGERGAAIQAEYRNLVDQRDMIKKRNAA